MADPNLELPISGMVTEIKLEAHEKVGGRAIPAHFYRTRNRYLHQAYKMLSTLLILFLEVESANAQGAITQFDRDKLRRNWDAVKEQFQFAYDNRNSVTTNVRVDIGVSIPTPKSIQNMVNNNLQVVAVELHQIVDYMIGTDSNILSSFIEDNEFADLLRIFGQVDILFDRWIGTDIDNPGIYIPGVTQIGRLSPDQDMDVLVRSEPSTGEKLGGDPDVADREPLLGYQSNKK